MTALVAPLFLSLFAQQTVEPPQVDALTTLTEEVRKAHGATTHATAADRFTARVQIEPPKEQDPIVVTLDVRFWRDGDSRPRSLIRYKVDEGGKKLERGRDTRGFWNRIGEEVTSLGARDQQTEREAVQQHVRLAKQMLEFLDPGKLLGSLRDKEPVRARVLKIVPRTDQPMPCQVVTGTADRFPLYGSTSEGRAQVSLWIETATHRLVAVDVHPLDEDGKPQADGERIRLTDHTTEAGLLLPTKLVIYKQENGSLHRLANVILQRLDLAPQLTEASFAREKAWD